MTASPLTPGPRQAPKRIPVTSLGRDTMHSHRRLCIVEGWPSPVTPCDAASLTAWGHMQRQRLPAPVQARQEPALPERGECWVRRSHIARRRTRRQTRRIRSLHLWGSRGLHSAAPLSRYDTIGQQPVTCGLGVLRLPACGKGPSIGPQGLRLGNRPRGPPSATRGISLSWIIRNDGRGLLSRLSRAGPGPSHGAPASPD